MPGASSWWWPAGSRSPAATASGRRNTFPEPPGYQPPPPPPAVEPVNGPPASAERITIARACASDIERFCSGVPPRQGMIKECMKSHVSELSAGCFDAVMGAIAAEQAP